MFFEEGLDPQREWIIGSVCPEKEENVLQWRFNASVPVLSRDVLVLLTKYPELDFTYPLLNGSNQSVNYTRSYYQQD